MPGTAVQDDWIQTKLGFHPSAAGLAELVKSGGLEGNAPLVGIKGNPPAAGVKALPSHDAGADKAQPSAGAGGGMPPGGGSGGGTPPGHGSNGGTPPGNGGEKSPVADVSATPVAVMSAADCEAAIRGCGSSWKKVKATYLKTPDVMKQLIAYRKATVDGIIKKLDVQFDGQLVAKSVGTTNLTSDYDITLTTLDGSGREIDAVVAFNAEVKGIFGVPPGVCFDTNLYVKDFLDVKDKSILGSEASPRHDKAAIDPIEELLAMDRSDQDVGALTKQRQYMGTKQWLAYKAGVIDGLTAIPDGKLRAKAIEESTTQFEEAENTYLIKASEKVQRFFDYLQKSPPAEDLPSDVGNKISLLRGKWLELTQSDDAAAGEEMHALVDEIAEFSHEHFEAEALEANNELYMEKMFAARDIQEKHKVLQVALDAPGNTPEEREKLTAEIDALRARAKKEITDANFFASEAYLSEGPLQHIVAGNQSGDKTAIQKLKPEHFLGSINEQFGDFMKDVGHYADNEAEAFCQTSKYVQRMLEGVHLLTQKAGFETMTFKSIGADKIKPMMDAISTELLPIRGAKEAWADKSDEERFAAAAIAAKKIYGVTSMKGLSDFANALSVEVNTQVRQAVAAAGGMRAGDAENKKFFANRG